LPGGVFSGSFKDWSTFSPNNFLSDAYPIQAFVCQTREMPQLLVGWNNFWSTRPSEPGALITRLNAEYVPAPIPAFTCP